MWYSLVPLVIFSSLPRVFAAEYLVGVGKDETTGKKGIGFDPSVIHPVAGDTVTWEFRSGRHSVLQSTFENPCTWNGGINTGIQTVSDSLEVDAPGLPVIRVIVNDTQSMWFFDEAGGLCNKGAVLALNPSTTQTAATFKDNAANAQTVAPSSSATSPTSSESASASLTASGSAPTSNSANKAITAVAQFLGFQLFSLLVFWKL